VTQKFASPDTHYSDLSSADPRSILTWATTTIDRLSVATSFQSSGLVILHMLRDLRPDLPVLFLDTGFHFPETLAFRERVTEMWDLKLVDLRGEHRSVMRQSELYGDELYLRDPDKCCLINKVKPLQDALEAYEGWISGLRRDQSPFRAQTPIVEAQLLPSGSEVLKIHPLAGWSRADVEGYISEHEIPTNPLIEQGFASIGCWPCTRAVSNGDSERAGRWDGLAKTECGIHTFGRGSEAEQ
jgi:phosphoadenosine phosphosulfate reductase